MLERTDERKPCRECLIAAGGDTSQVRVAELAGLCSMHWQRQYRATKNSNSRKDKKRFLQALVKIADALVEIDAKPETSDVVWDALSPYMAALHAAVPRMITKAEELECETPAEPPPLVLERIPADVPATTNAHTPGPAESELREENVQAALKNKSKLHGNKVKAAAMKQVPANPEGA